MELINSYSIPLVVGICLCVGYIIKHVILTNKVNRYIPLIMGVLGVVINIWLNLSFTPQILLEGLISGLGSTGLYETFKNVISSRGGVKDEN